MEIAKSYRIFLIAWLQCKIKVAVVALDLSSFTLDKPEIVNRSEATTHNVMSWIGRETNITCEVEGVPLPEIIWTRDGKVASSKKLNRRVSTLTFTPKRESDFGAYLCKASNFLGVARKVINVEILGKFPLKVLKIVYAQVVPTKTLFMLVILKLDVWVKVQEAIH